MHKKFWKLFFIFGINASELLALNCLYYEKKFLSLPVIVLTKSLKILHVTKSNFFQLNFLCSGQLIW